MISDKAIKSFNNIKLYKFRMCENIITKCKEEAINLTIQTKETGLYAGDICKIMKNLIFKKLDNKELLRLKLLGAKNISILDTRIMKKYDFDSIAEKGGSI